MLDTTEFKFQSIHQNSTVHQIPKPIGIITTGAMKPMVRYKQHYLLHA